MSEQHELDLQMEHLLNLSQQVQEHNKKILAQDELENLVARLYSEKGL